LVPVAGHGLLLVRYLEAPTVHVDISTLCKAYPAMLPSNKAKLLQLDEIKEEVRDCGTHCKVLLSSWQL
jgi:hypothetical protein